jgi:exosortase/archaeosortase family protein
MTTLAYCLAFFLGSKDWRRRTTLVVLAPVLAIAANTVRIALLCLLARWCGVPFAQGTGHDLANAGEWLALLGALLVVDLLLGRLPQRAARQRREVPLAGTAPASEGPAPRFVPTAAALWLLAVPLLALSLYRPVPSTTLRAAQLPARVADWTLVPRTAADEAAFQKNVPRWRELLGTADFVWRCYRNAAGREVYVVALFHDSNWKSVHPPRICIEGSNMDILVDDEVASAALGENVRAGRILARRRSDAARYLTMSVFGTGDWLGGGYWEFTRHHLPLALLRANQTGFLLRAEMRVRDGEEVAAVQAECTRFLQALVPQARERLR